MRVLFVLSATLVLAQQSNPDANVVFQSQTREVLLEVVVRDAHGKLVTKLDPSQVSVYEDGVRQDIKSFRLVPGREVRAEVQREMALAATKPDALHLDAAQARPPSNPLRTVNVVCLILNDITKETRPFAFDAARKFVDKELRPDTFIGVFTLDITGLRPVFPFSNNRANLMKAIELASQNQLAKLNPDTAAMLNGLSISTLGAPLAGSGAITTTVAPGVSVATSPGAGVPGLVDGASAQDPLGTRGDMEDATITGLFEIDALKTLVKQLSELPFQKTVLLMSTGLTRPPDQLEYWDSLIKLAVKGGITFYGLDVHGLDPFYNPIETSAAGVQGVASMSQGQSGVGLSAGGKTAPGGSSTIGPSSAEQLMQSMKQTDFLAFAVLSTNKQEALREIAESTGGFIIANTNNTEALLTKVMEDVDTHYELAYRPATPSADGHFRKIEVKVTPAGLRVQTRNGYFAVPETGEGPLTAGDFGALLALDAKPRPHAFDFGAKAFRFRSGKGTSQYSIAFEVPISSLTATAEDNVKKHRYHAYLLALVKNAQGEVVDRVSRDVPSEVGDDYLPGLRSDKMIYEHAVNLSPGHYTVETAVVDQEGNRASTNVFQIESREQPGPDVSDVMLVRGVHTLDRPADAADPFEVSGKRAQPFVSTTLPAGALPYIYFVVYPPEETQQTATLRTQFLKSGKVLSTQQSVLPQPDSSGAIPMALQPIAYPGDYEVRITVELAGRSVERSLQYRIAAK
jgi:VWFA-related protein